MRSGVATRPVPPPAQLEAWLAQRVEQRKAFLQRCIAWGVPRGGELVWPQDESEILALGVPCDHCVTVVTDLQAGELPHTLRVTMYGSGHWSDGIVAQCGGVPTWPLEGGA